MKKIFLLIITLGTAVSLKAQQPVSSQEMIGITPIVCEAVNIPSDARASLSQKLMQMATMNGFGSVSGRFALTSNVVTIDKQVTASAPPQFVIELEVSFYVVDVIEQVVLDEMSVSVKGVDRLENKATIKAINSINARSPQMRKFMTGVREKITDYYSTRIPTILKKADTYAQMRNYDMALYVLADIPESVEEYPMVADKMVDIYIKKLDSDALMLINRGEAAITAGDYDTALAYLSAVDPYSTHIKKAKSLIGSIKSNLDEQKLAEAEARQRAEDDAMLIKQMELQNAREAGVRQAQNQDVKNEFMKDLGKWFLGKF